MSWNGFLLVGLFTLYLWFDVTQAEVNLNNVRLSCKKIEILIKCFNFFW